MESQESALERKRKRLEAWKRKKQQQEATAAAPPPAPPPAPKVSLTLFTKTSKSTVSKKKPKPVSIHNAFGESDDSEGESSGTVAKPAASLKRKSLLDVQQQQEEQQQGDDTAQPKRKKRKGRWDGGGTKEKEPVGKDALDEFMENLTSWINENNAVNNAVNNDASGSSSTAGAGATSTSPAVAPVDDEEEEKARRALVEALKHAQPVRDAAVASEENNEESGVPQPAQTLAEVRSEKARREQRLAELERQAAEARASAESAAEPKFGRIYMDSEGGIVEEAERNLDAAKATPDALVVLAELNKKKELKAVDHSTIDYMPFQKNLYRVPRSLANLTNDDVISRRANLKVRVRGHGA